MKASKFLEKMFAGRTKGNVFLCSYANDRREAKELPPRDLVTRDWAKADAFVKEFDIAGRACYFACSTMMGRVRNKEEVAHINSVFTDLDFKGIVEAESYVMEVLAGLALPPSVVVHSGNGLHCYWLLEPPQSVEHSASCEDLMRRICAMLAGDRSAAETARVLRLPGSHNSKNGDWKNVDVVAGLANWRTYSYAKLDQYFKADAEPLLIYKSTKRDAEIDIRPLNIYQLLAREIRADYGRGFDANEFIDKMVLHDVMGCGIDDTYTHVVGGMVRQGCTIKECLDTLLGPTKRVYERDRASGERPWDEKFAIKEIKKKFIRFTKADAKKEDAVPAQQENPQMAGTENQERVEGETKKKIEYDSDPPEEKKVNGYWIAPHDFWSMVPTETMRTGMVPAVIENVAFEYADRNGFNRDALVMSMLTVASSVIATDIKVAAYNESDNKFVEAIRFWTANVGVAGSGKSPILKAVRGPLDEIEAEKRRDYNARMLVYTELSKEDQKNTDKPKRERVLVPIDASTEGVQLAFADNKDGMLGAYDELVTFFGSKQRYSGKGNGGEQTSRGFWLSTYDSSHFSLVRVNRAEIDCKPSCSIVGGVQPTVLRDLLDEVSRNDGLVQRFNPVILPDRMNPPNKSLEPKYPLTIYENLIKGIYKNCPLRMSGTTLQLSPKAGEVRDLMFAWVDDQTAYQRSRNRQLASHINKYKGMFLRFCGLFHMIEYYQDKQARMISADTANMVYRFMTSVRLKHAECFYNLIIENEETEDMKNIALFILAHKIEEVTPREIQRGSARFKNISTRDIAHTVGNMISLGWLHQLQGKRVDSLRWKVNPDVHQLYKEHALTAREANAESRRIFELNKATKEADDIPPEKLN